MCVPLSRKKLRPVPPIIMEARNIEMDSSKQRRATDTIRRFIQQQRARAARRVFLVKGTMNIELSRTDDRTKAYTHTWPETEEFTEQMTAAELTRKMGGSYMQLLNALSFNNRRLAAGAIEKAIDRIQYNAAVISVTGVTITPMRNVSIKDVPMNGMHLLYTTLADTIKPVWPDLCVVDYLCWEGQKVESRKNWTYA